MNVSYYPGCCMQGTAKGYDQSIQAISRSLDLELIEVDGWTCCGASSAHATDFELSVRARNCLKKMQIRTLGDLLRISEAELLSYKNFGETSLTEIKTMLASKGLRLGQGLEGQYTWARRQMYDQLRGRATDAVLNKPISVLDLSVLNLEDSKPLFSKKAAGTKKKTATRRKAS